MKQSNYLMILAALTLLGLFFLPMWNITLEAPQYPDPIGMDIHIDRFTDAQPNNIKNINIMNHYVGMQEIPETIPEFEIFPYFVVGMIALGIALAFVGNRKLYLLWLVVLIILCVIALYDFYLWEYDYGHNLRQNAAIKFTDASGDPMSYQPPLLGAKKILNFRAISMPRSATYLMIGGMTLSLIAFWKAKKEA